MTQTTVTSRDSFHETARDAPAGARVPVEVRVEVGDPFVAYRRARDGEGGFYLETTGGQSGWGYFGVEPRCVRRVETGTGFSLDALTALADGTLVRGGCDVPYPCGSVGWLSYDIARELEALPDETADRGLPRLEFGFYDCMAAWEEPHDEPVTLRVTACPRVGDVSNDERLDSVALVENAYEAGRARAVALARAACNGDPAVAEPPDSGATERFESECSRRAFGERVAEIRRAIRDGETFQANVSHRLTAPATVHPVCVFDALRSANPAPYSALVEFPSVDLVSASPELLCEHDGTSITTEPIAGTRPRGETPERDRALEDDLRGNEKERAEHAMLVDLERNDLGKICGYGSVAVSDYRRVDRYASVMHLVSVVEGRLREDVDLADVLAAVFPGGTITGAPKPRTMELVEGVEATRRGPYTGSLGIVGLDDRATFDILIRTLVRHDDEYSLRVGAGVVHDSDPDAEYDETLDKAGGVADALSRALGVDMSVENPNEEERPNAGGVES